MSLEKVGFNDLNVESGSRPAPKRDRREREEVRESKSVNVLGLSGADSLLIGSYGDSEVLNEMAEVCGEVLKSVKSDVKLFKLDLNKFDLWFSHLLFAYKGDNGKTYYFSVLLEATGREPLDIHTVVDGLGDRKSLDTLVTADAFDDDFFDTAEGLLNRLLDTKSEDAKFCQGVIIPAGADVEQTGKIVTRYAQDIIISNYAKDTGVQPDVTVEAIDAYMGKGSLNLDLSFNDGGSINMLGRAIRTDFNVEVNVNRNNDIRRVNRRDGRRKLTTTSGFLDYVIGEEDDPRTGIVKRIAKPMIILNEFIGSAPTINYALLNIAAATTFTDRRVLRSFIIERDAGPLNYLFNYRGEGMYGERMSFKDEKAAPEYVNDIIRQHITPNPIFAIDIEEFGPSYPYLRSFSALAEPDSARYANDDILDACSDLTGVKMPNIKVAKDTLHVPLGEFKDNNGEVRDIREIDTTFVIEHITEQAIITDWLYTNAAPGICLSERGKDPYILKLETLDKIASVMGLKLRITGRAVRVVLEADFVNELTGSCIEAGYSPNADSPNIGYTDFNNLQNIAASYATAAVSSTGFGVTASRRGSEAMYGRGNRYRR